ncbi:MAG: class I SAM-dependent methyltransferase [Rhodanobacteraceae bacterium]
MSKIYDRTYFDKWYRGGCEIVGSRSELARKVTLVVALAEYYLGREVCSVLDVGCGEAPWRAPLRALRPKLAYFGLDTSDYVVSRYGRSRNIRCARFGQLGELRFDSRFDIIVCSDVLHYVGAREIHRGLGGFGEVLEGLAFLEVFTTRDSPAGDHDGFIARTPRWYRETFAGAGLIACGSHAYLSPHLWRSVAALECLPP